MKTVVSLIVCSVPFIACGLSAWAADLMPAEQIAEFRKARAHITDEALKNGQHQPSQWGSRINLSFTAVTDAGLGQLPRFDKLHRIDLGYLKITDAGLAPLKEMKSLETLQLQDTQATPQGIEELKKALPNCQINRGQGNRRAK